MRRLSLGRPAAAPICAPPLIDAADDRTPYPRQGVVQLEHLVCDVNGTIALDGQLLEDVAKRLLGLQDRLAIHLITTDTHGRQDRIDQQLGLQATRIPAGEEMEAKATFVQALTSDHVVAIGQGANDAHMLREAAVGICTISPEGVALEALSAADLLAPDIVTALDLLENPLRLVATLR